MRSPTRSRYYIQCGAEDGVTRGPMNDFGASFGNVCRQFAEAVETGPSIEEHRASSVVFSP
jgi:hypothetical protein